MISIDQQILIARKHPELAGSPRQLLLGDKINDAAVYGVHRILRRIKQGHRTYFVDLAGHTAREAEHGINCGRGEYLSRLAGIAQMGVDIVLRLRTVEGHKGKAEVDALGDGLEYFLG